jgi:hypothetical protein
MSKSKESVLVGVANEGELNFPLEMVEGWEPKKIANVGSTVFFEHDDKFFSMERSKFKEIFGSKFYKFK